MESKTNRYQSRILREMHQNKENPFNSPPSSTGSHGTITLTSNFTEEPLAESTRRVDDGDESIRLPSHATAARAGKSSSYQPLPLSFQVNTSALGRTFPEWSRWDPNGVVADKDPWETGSDSAPVPDGKENITPRRSPNNSPVAATPRADESDKDKAESAKESHASDDRGSKASRGSVRTRAQMQPRVQTESECSVELPEPLANPLQSRGSRDGRDEQAPSARPRSSTPTSSKGSKPRRGNVTTLLKTLKTAQIKQAESKESPASQVSPRSHSPVQSHIASRVHPERQSGLGNMANSMIHNLTARSFFLPNLSHMNDFLSGALKLSSFRNGVPVFVKHGKVHDRDSTLSPDHHADVEAISIPEDEEKIFVSLDKIKDEIQALKEHDELVSKQADQLEEEVEELHVQIAQYKSRKDSAMGSDSEGSMIDHLNAQKMQLEDQIASLQARLDKANRQISLNDIHTESYVAERDEALKSASQHLEKMQQLQSERDLAYAELEKLRNGNSQDGGALESENRSLRKDNNTIRQQWKSLLDENQSLRSHNSAVGQQNADLEHDLKAARSQLDSNKTEFESLNHEYELALSEQALLKQENLSLGQHNDKILNEKKALQKQNSLLERRAHALESDIARLQKLLDVADAEPGTTSADIKDIKYRLEVQNSRLAKENAELQQRIIDLESEFSAQRMNLEREKRHLATANERLKDQIEDISKLFEQVIKESKAEAIRSEEQHATLTQQLELVTGKESALSEKLKKSASLEAALQSKLNRKADAVNEARQLTQEIKNFMSVINKKHIGKTTRVAEPKGKSAANETTARSTTSQIDLAAQDDYTQQIDLTQGSDFASIFTQDEIPRLREALRQIRGETHQRDLTTGSSDFDGEDEDDGMSDQASQSLPTFPLQGRPRTAGSQRPAPETLKGRTDPIKTQPIGILKDTQPSRLTVQKQKTSRTGVDTGFDEARELDKTGDSVTGGRKSKSNNISPRKVSFSQNGRTQRSVSDSRPVSEPDLSGRFNIKSGHSETSRTGGHVRRNSDSVQFDMDANHEDNMTSALFMDDITLEQQKTAAKQKTNKSNPELSKDAKRVLDNLCHDHDCRNCMVCARINSHKRDEGNAHGDSKKKTVQVERPIPVSERPRDQPEYEDQSTLRPSQDPAIALAKVIKGLQDEERHIQKALAKKTAVYNECDPAIHRRMWKQMAAEIEKLRKAQDLKRDQIYYLHDVLEGLKANGLEMTSSFVEETIMTVLSKDPTWNGIPGY
ncbi:hypothetical protein GGS23DRAFT_562383 [Durotheca rogersii]|uniref:uncharacterized protein n=1 Tax=Durotheca rogersii TaxID=419775 RepID=UPI00221E7351|nr:uncharacterized protein GGS23DRAFT_562383 [Durotheca rogersii]KAI5864926.1 hypothetical protein GGS23DRAFT_562383 [Durotheca rogersii]